jgi:putative SOS response-associated peptidase YedK
LCGRYELRGPLGESEAFPGQLLPALVAPGRVMTLRWGFASLLPGGRPHINARIESAAASKTFGASFALSRCLLPASAYFEWRKTASGSVKTRASFGEGEHFLAGLCQNGAFAILTREAAPEIQALHGRMPVIVPTAAAEAWLLRGELPAQVPTLSLEPLPGESEQLGFFDEAF